MTVGTTNSQSVAGANIAAKPQPVIAASSPQDALGSFTANAATATAATGTVQRNQPPRSAGQPPVLEADKQQVQQEQEQQRQVYAALSPQQMEQELLDTQERLRLLTNVMQQKAKPVAPTLIKAASQSPHANNELLSGVQTSTRAEALSDSSAKTYRHMVPGARFIMPNGMALVFMGGQYTTNDPYEIAQLDRVADKLASQVYTKQDAKNATLAQIKQVAVDAAKDTPAE